MVGLREDVHGGKAAEVGANNSNVEAECGTATVIEWWDLLDGVVPRDLQWGILCIVICGKKRGRSEEGRGGVALAF